MAKIILTEKQIKILAFLSKNKHFQDRFYFTGGTVLAEYYLKHRLSEDLDFFSEQEIDLLWVTTLAREVKEKLGAEKFDIEQSFNRNLVFFTWENDLIKTEFTYFPFPQIENPRIQDGIKIDSLTDIAVNKFFTIYQTPAARHFIDLYLIIKQGHAKWEDLGALARIKFDTIIDPIQLGSQLITASEVLDLPNMLTKLPEDKWRSYFIDRAKELKKVLG